MITDNAGRAAKPDILSPQCAPDAPLTADGIVQMLARDLARNQRMIAQCRRISRNDERSDEQQLQAIDRATRLIRADTAIAALLLRHEAQAAKKKSANESDASAGEEGWNDFWREVEAKQRKKIRQTNGT